MGEQPNLHRPELPRAYYDGRTLTVGHRRMVLSSDEANAVRRAIIDWNTQQHKAWEDRQRADGQVWTVTYSQYGQRYTEEEFSLDDAVALLYYGEENGTLTAVGGSIVLPGGEVVEGDALWSMLRAMGGVSS